MNLKFLKYVTQKKPFRVLNENQLAGYFLPCKIVVYEDQGNTKIGMPRPTALISLLNDEKMKKTGKGY
jgi:uncharacterized protein (DUF302 family)